MISKVFPCKVLQIHITSISGSCRHKYDPSISRIFLSYFWQVFCNLAKLRPPTKPGRGRTTACMTLWPLFYLLPLSCCWLRMASLLANLFQFAENEVPPVSLSLYFGHFHHICQRVLYHQNQQKGILES